MNLIWQDTTKYDCVEFNKWSDEANYINSSQSVRDGVKNINKYLHANRYGGFGVLIRQFVNFQEFTADDYFVKTAIHKNKIVGVTVTFKHPNKNILECMVLGVNPTCQGKGYGSAMVFDIVKDHVKLFGLTETCEITAFIDKENVASQLAFKKHGFVKTNKQFKKIEGITPVNEQYSLEPKIIIQTKQELDRKDKIKHEKNQQHIVNVIAHSKVQNEKTR